jgi:hypothetical protein
MQTEMPAMVVDPSVISLQALAFVAADEALLPRFLALSGLSPQSLRAAAGDPETHAAVLQFVLGHEPTARAFAESAGLSADALHRAAHQLGVTL